MFEGQLEDGPHLVSAPVRSLENIWQAELKHQPFPVFTAEEPAERKRQLELGLTFAEAGAPCWLLLNPDSLRLKKLPDDWDGPVARRDHKGSMYGYRDELQERLLNVSWKTFTIDEFHKTGLNSTLSLFRLGAGLVEAERRYGLSGTPMGGKPIRLFQPLQWIEPKLFGSMWRWADDWLVIDDNGFGKTIGAMQPGREQQFYKAHARHMVRRLKREALPGLPAKLINVVMCKMTPKQRKVYKRFARDAEVRIEGGRVTATNLLSEYSRLKQFANALCEVNEDGEVTPTTESGKLDQLLQKLDEHGIRKADPEPGARAIIASESKRMVVMVTDWLNSKGIYADMLTGDTKDSRPIISRFQDYDDDCLMVLVMTTQTGGVSLNLERADSVHVLDESWNPDDQLQLEDRADRGSRTTPLVVYRYRSIGTIQDYIAEVNADKEINNANIMDIHRKLVKGKLT